jgi:hypothetical protein
MRSATRPEHRSRAKSRRRQSKSSWRRGPPGGLRLSPASRTSSRWMLLDDRPLRPDPGRNATASGGSPCLVRSALAASSPTGVTRRPLTAPETHPLVHERRPMTGVKRRPATDNQRSDGYMADVHRALRVAPNVSQSHASCNYKSMSVDVAGETADAGAVHNAGLRPAGILGSAADMKAGHLPQATAHPARRQNQDIPPSSRTRSPRVYLCTGSPQVGSAGASGGRFPSTKSPMKPETCIHEDGEVSRHLPRAITLLDPAGSSCGARARFRSMTSISAGAGRVPLCADRRSSRCVRACVPTSTETPTERGSLTRRDGQGVNRGNGSCSGASPGGRPGSALPRI